MRAALVGLLVLALSGCAAFNEDSSGIDTSDGIQVTAAFYPLQYAAHRVAGGELAAVTTRFRPACLAW